eukprot:8792776-Ditylum_brightwellii.AAC.1
MDSTSNHKGYETHCDSKEKALRVPLPDNTDPVTDTTCQHHTFTFTPSHPNSLKPQRASTLTPSTFEDYIQTLPS